jgi:hypothetical protein
MNLEELKKQENELLEQLSDNRTKQREINRDNFLKKHGIKFGDTIEYMFGKIKIVGVVHKLEYSACNVNYLCILKHNSDGKVGKIEKRICTYEMQTLKILKSE